MNPAWANFTSDLNAFLSKNYQGEMEWLQNRQAWRASPKALWPEAQSVIVLAESYDAPTNPASADCGEISAYARGRDYHDVVKKRLKALGREWVARSNEEIKVFVDTAPVMEKPIAQISGMGWQGKHGNLVSRKLGNWFFLGEIFTTATLEYDTPEADYCGSCQACLQACPTEAFDANGHLDPRRCISYLTIEHSGTIAEEFRKPMSNLIYGCDICLKACPWNKFETPANDPRLKARESATAPKLATLLTMDDAAFRSHFQGSAIKRIGWSRMMRNCLIAAGNSNDKTLRPLIQNFTQSADPILKETAQWALAQLKTSGGRNE